MQYGKMGFHKVSSSTGLFCRIFPWFNTPHSTNQLICQEFHDLKWVYQMGDCKRDWDILNNTFIGEKKYIRYIKKYIYFFIYLNLSLICCVLVWLILTAIKMWRTAWITTIFMLTCKFVFLCIYWECHCFYLFSSVYAIYALDLTFGLYLIVHTVIRAQTTMADVTEATDTTDDVTNDSMTNTTEELPTKVTMESITSSTDESITGLTGKFTSLRTIASTSQKRIY